MWLREANGLLKVLAIDVDGTLLRSDLSISRRTRRAITKAQERGVVVMVATGRRPATAARFAAEIGAGSAPLVTLDGALVLDGQRQPLLSVPLPEAVVQHVLMVARAHHAIATAFTETQTYRIGQVRSARLWRRALRRRVWRPSGIRHLLWDVRLPPAPLVDASVLRGQAVLKIGIVGSGEGTARPVLEADLVGDAWFTMPAGHGTEIVAPGVNKGLGLRAVAGHIDVSLSQMMAVGDNFNDVAMLRLAGSAYLMGNAPKALWLPVTKTLSTDRDGLARAIEEAILR